MSILLKNCRYIVTQNEKRDILRNKDVLIEGNTISEIGEKLKNADEVIDASRKIIMPGLINLHTHSAMNLLKGYCDDLSVENWLKKVRPIEAKMSPEDIKWGARLALLEMVKTGTTTFNDMYFHMDEIVHATKQVGVRAFLSYGMVDLGNKAKREAEIKETNRFAKFIKSLNDPMIKFCVGPHSIAACSDELLYAAKEIAEREKAILHMHVSENKAEVEDCVDKFKKRPVVKLHDMGLLGPKTIMAHAVWVNDTEWSIIKGTKTKIAHCPISNMKLASGIPPLRGLREAYSGLGSDSATSNNNLSMFEEMKIAALLHKLNSSDASAISAQEVLDMATRNGADALGINAGRIEKGKLADILTINAGQILLNPLRMDNLIANLIYSAGGHDVSDAIINGKLIMQQRKVFTLNPDEVVEEANKRSKKLFGGD